MNIIKSRTLSGIDATACAHSTDTTGFIMKLNCTQHGGLP